jgi:hypothetical protein
MNSETLTQTDLRAILSLKESEDVQVSNGDIWFLLRDIDGGYEYKVSPHGKDGDYDTDCQWIPRQTVKQWKTNNDAYS